LGEVFREADVAHQAGGARDQPRRLDPPTASMARLTSAPAEQGHDDLPARTGSPAISTVRRASRGWPPTSAWTSAASDRSTAAVVVCTWLALGFLVSTAATTAVQVMGTEAGKAAATSIGEAMTFWVDTRSIDPASTAVRTLQSYTVPIAGLILVISVMAQSVKMMRSRRKDPLLNITVGLARYAVATAVGLALLTAALQAVDELSQSLVDQGLADYGVAQARGDGRVRDQVLDPHMGVMCRSSILLQPFLA
jgi:hypothetical protein